MQELVDVLIGHRRVVQRVLLPAVRRLRFVITAGTLAFRPGVHDRTGRDAARQKCSTVASARLEVRLDDVDHLVDRMGLCVGAVALLQATRNREMRSVPSRPSNNFVHGVLQCV